MMPINTEKAIKMLSKEGLIKDISISVFKENKYIEDFEKFNKGDLFHIFSAGKPFIASVLWKLYERKIIDFDDPISKFWPEFGKKNKQDITIKHILTHSSGISITSSLLDHDYVDLNRVCRWIENYEPESKPGEKISYHEVTYGWILGEIIQRITNKTFNENFHEYVANPLGLESTNFNLEGKNFPKEIFRHESSELKTIPSIFKLLLINKIPMISGTCISSSYDLAKFYNELINNDKWLNKNIKKEVTRVHKEGNDHNSELKFTRLGLGVRINSKIINIDDSNSNSEVFGHSGLVSCVGLASYDQNISLAILNNLLLSDQLNEHRMRAIISAIIMDIDKMKI